jgi:excinuclease UvrABC helicase subunit UvrB
MNDLFKDLFGSFFNMNDDFGFNSYPSDNDPNFKKTIEEIDNGSHTIKIETWKSLDGSKIYKRTSMVSKSSPNLSEGRKKELLEILQKNLDLAVDNEEYEKAAEIRDQIKKIKND